MKTSLAGETPGDRRSGDRRSRGDNLQPRPPFERRNQVAARHRFYVSQLAPTDAAEVQEIADVLRELSPVYGEALEPLVQGVAGKLWRRKAYADCLSTVSSAAAGGCRRRSSST